MACTTVVEVPVPKIDRFTIGVIIPQSGDFAPYAEDFLKGIRCFEEYHPDLHLIIYDNASEGDKTIEGCRMLIDSGVHAIIGPLTSENSRRAIDYCAGTGVPVLPLWATENELTEGSSGAFRLIYSNGYTGYLLAKFSAENLNSRRAAVVYSDFKAWIEMKEGFVETFSEAVPQGTVKELLWTGKQDDFFTELKAFAPDVIYLAHSSALQDGGELLSGFSRYGIEAAVLGDSDWSSVDPGRVSGSPRSEFYYLNHYDASSYSTAGREFLERFRGTFGEDPSGLAALGYENLYILSQAADFLKTSSDSPEKILASREFQGLLGKLNFDEAGNARKSAVIMRILNDASQYVTTLVPEFFSLQEFEKELPLKSPPAGEKLKIAILPLEGENVFESDTRIVSELMSTALVKTNRYEVIEPDRREEIIKEVEFSLSGMTEDNQIEIGKLMAAEKLIVGSFGRIGEQYVINMKLLDIESGATLFATYKIYRNMEELLGNCDFFTYELISRDEIL